MLLICLLVFHTTGLTQTRAIDPNTIARKMEWFSDARLGIFLHWGIYAVNGIGESWSFHNREISHADYMNIPRDTPLKKAIYACDELVGFIGACVKVRPSKSIHDLPVESVVKKLKDKAFARSVDRTYVYGGAVAVGRSLEEHTGFVIEALKPVAEKLSA